MLWDMLLTFPLMENRNDEQSSTGIVVNIMDHTRVGVPESGMSFSVVEEPRARIQLF